MNSKRELSRRTFVSSALSASALSAFPSTHKLIPSLFSAEPHAPVPLDTTAAPRDQAILNLTHSPHAKLHGVPVHAVTIEPGFWSPRRQTNVDSSIPSMGKLLEVNGRMDNFRRLTGKTEA